MEDLQSRSCDGIGIGRIIGEYVVDVGVVGRGGAGVGEEREEGLEVWWRGYGW